MLMGRMLKSKVPVISSKLIPKSIDNDIIHAKIERKRQLDKYYYDHTAKQRNEFKEGENVVLREDKEWIPARIEKKLIDTPRSYIVRDKNNKIFRRNSSFLRRSLNEPNFRSELDVDTNVELSSDVSDSCSHLSQRQDQDGKLSKRIVRLPSKFKDHEMY